MTAKPFDLARVAILVTYQCGCICEFDSRDSARLRRSHHCRKHNEKSLIKHAAGEVAKMVVDQSNKAQEDAA